MTTMAARGTAWLLALGAAWGTAWLSRAPIAPHESDRAILRLAWSARPERMETCRPQSEEVLARLPPHMRQAMVCEGYTAEYRLQVRLDDALVIDRVVHGGGLRRDRALYVFEEVPLPPRETAVAVTFRRIDPEPAVAGATSSAGERRAPQAAERDGDDDDDDRDRLQSVMDETRRQREAQERERRRGEAVPAHLSLVQRMQVPTRRVVLVTYSAEERTLTLRR
jgi:hypothetical protein